MRRRNPQLGLVELWHRLKKRGYNPVALRACFASYASCEMYLAGVSVRRELYPEKRPLKSLKAKGILEMKKGDIMGESLLSHMKPRELQIFQKMSL